MCLPFHVSLCHRPDPLPDMGSGQRYVQLFMLQKEVIALFVAACTTAFSSGDGIFVEGFRTIRKQIAVKLLH